LKSKGNNFLKKFIYTSSSMVYGNFKEDPVKEEHSTDPINVYGTMKLGGEIVTRGLCNTYGIDHIIIRPSAVYGPTDMNRRVTQIFVENAMQGKKLIVMGKDEKLDFSYVDDVAQGFIQALLSDVKNETFNLTGGDPKTLLEYAQLVKKYFPEVEIEVEEREKDRPLRGGLDISKARKEFNYNPKYDLESGVKEYIEFLKNKQ